MEVWGIIWNWEEKRKTEWWGVVGDNLEVKGENKKDWMKRKNERKHANEKKK